MEGFMPKDPKGVLPEGENRIFHSSYIKDFRVIDVFEEVGQANIKQEAQIEDVEKPMPGDEGVSQLCMSQSQRREILKQASKSQCDDVLGACKQRQFRLGEL